MESQAVKILNRVKTFLRLRNIVLNLIFSSSKIRQSKSIDVYTSYEGLDNGIVQQHTRKVLRVEENETDK